jgi:DNA-directed RNA polymerase subunit RPC12/RpoP
MPATITVVCPECKKAIHAAADIAGKKVRCKQCGNVFRANPAPPAGAIARSPAGKPAAAPVAPVVQDDDDGDSNPYQVTGDSAGTYRCPECANEMESPDAVICLHCGYNTMTRERLALRKVHDTTGGDYFLWLAPGVACAVGVLMIILLDVLYCVFVKSVKKDDGLLLVFFAWSATKMWVTIGCIAVCFFMGKFAYKRLLLHPTPPEVEHH